MSDMIPRVRMFAGPNGSGKTTVKNSLEKPPSWFGDYLNPDDIEASIRSTGSFKIDEAHSTITLQSLREFLADSSALARAGVRFDPQAFNLERGRIIVAPSFCNSYVASALTDFLRQTCLTERRSFSFETVMSHPDKIEVFRMAHAHGFRCYLYYIATDAPEINVQRVLNRVSTGGHTVPEDKIIDRYHRSLQLLPDAIRNADRAFFFDTSLENQPLYFANAVNGKEFTLFCDDVPLWFKPVWSSFHQHN